MRVLYFSPVFNQDQELPALIRELQAAPLACDEFLFVNNGSTDGSRQLLADSGYSVVDVSENRGVGYGIITAIRYGLEHGYDVLGGLAANGKMDPAEMGRVTAPILRGEADYVTGSRFLQGGRYPNLPTFRRWAIPAVNLLVWGLTGRWVTDATCGYRAYRLDLISRADFEWDAPWLWTYGFEYYLYAKVLQDRSLRAVEVPVAMRYPPRGKRYTKIRAGRDWWRMIKPWLIARVDGKGFRETPATRA